MSGINDNDNAIIPATTTTTSGDDDDDDNNDINNNTDVVAYESTDDLPPDFVIEGDLQLNTEQMRH